MEESIKQDAISKDRVKSLETQSRRTANLVEELNHCLHNCAYGHSFQQQIDHLARAFEALRANADANADVVYKYFRSSESTAIGSKLDFINCVLSSITANSCGNDWLGALKRGLVKVNLESVDVDDNLSSILADIKKSELQDELTHAQADLERLGRVESDLREKKKQVFGGLLLFITTHDGCIARYMSRCLAL